LKKYIANLPLFKFKTVTRVRKEDTVKDIKNRMVVCIVQSIECSWIRLVTRQFRFIAHWRHDKIMFQNTRQACFGIFAELPPYATQNVHMALSGECSIQNSCPFIADIVVWNSRVSVIFRK